MRRLIPLSWFLAEYEAVNRTLSSFLVLQFYSDRKKSHLFGDKLVWFDSECKTCFHFKLSRTVNPRTYMILKETPSAHSQLFIFTFE